LLASGTGATLSPASGVDHGEFLVAIDVQTSARPENPDGVIRLASVVEREWLTPTQTDREHWIDASGVVRAADIDRYDALTLSQRPAKPDQSTVEALLVTEWLSRERNPSDARLIQRLKFAAVEPDLTALVARATVGSRSLDEIRLVRGLSHEVLARLARDAPEALTVPSGRSVELRYGDDGSVSASVKLQELFGLGETPRIGVRREPVVLSLLAPNGRPVQVTRDLRSFWNRTYPDVRKELRGRYPKHPWPEDPWSAPPTARTTRRIRS
jgi:ATP-dependent helicase HrpB